MKVLLDTCIISDISRAHKKDLLKGVLYSIGEDNCFMSVVTLGEITHGIHLLEEGKKKKDLLLWINQIEVYYGNRLLTFDNEVAKIWGELSAKAKKAGRSIPIADGMIAATALLYGLHVMTENTKDFESSGVLLINPYS
ncbi:MAG: type II toxin-antitoxin system VapC family toxin [Candidatus Omnitrophota bacterium]